MSYVELDSLQHRKFGFIQLTKNTTHKKDPSFKLGSEDKEDKERMLNS